MSTHDAGSGNERLNLAVPKEMKVQLKRLAEQSNLSMSAYIKKVLKDALDANVTFQLTPKVAESKADCNAPKLESPAKKTPPPGRKGNGTTGE